MTSILGESPRPSLGVPNFHVARAICLAQARVCRCSGCQRGPPGPGSGFATFTFIQHCQKVSCLPFLGLLKVVHHCARQYGNGASSSLSLPPSWTTTVSATTGASEGAIVAMGARGVASARIDGWASVSLWRAATCAGGAVADAGCGLICSSEPPSAGFGPRLAFLLPTGRPGFLGAARAGTV